MVTILVVFLFSGGLGQFSWFSVILGVVLGVASVFGLAAALDALRIGPFSYTTVLTSLSAIIPTLSGLFFGETVSAAQYAGIVLMVVCIVLSTDKKEENKQGGIKWLIYVAVAFVCSGAVGVVQKIHQNSDMHKGEMPALLICGFMVATFISLIFFIKNFRTSDMIAVKTKTVLFPIIAGVAFAFPNAINLFLAGALPAAVMFPTVNLSPMLLSMITGIIIFKEKLSPKRWTGVILGIAGVVLVSGII
jgi:drug/metabolite transporter (DMT)-like permease